MNKTAFTLTLLLLLTMRDRPVKVYERPNFDGEGYRFTVLCHEDSPFSSDELSGETVNDALYNRDRRIEQLFNVELASMKSSDPTKQITNEVLAADAQSEIALLGVSSAIPRAEMGFFVDQKSLDALTLKGVWWDRELNKSLESPDGRLFASANDISSANFARTSAVIYDRAALGDYPLELARSGNWTLDELLRLEKDSGITFTRGDSAEALLLGAGADFVSFDMTVAPVSVQMLDAADRIRELLGAQTIEAPSVQLATIAALTERAMSDPLLLPMPKLDSGDDYISPITDDYELLVIPVTMRDSRLTGTIVDALQYYTSTDVNPVLTEKYVLDTRSIGENIEMLDLIRTSRAFDERAIRNCDSIEPERLEKALRDGNLTSLLVQVEGIMQKALDRHVKSFEEIPIYDYD